MKRKAITAALLMAAALLCVQISVYAGSDEVITDLGEYGFEYIDDGYDVRDNMPSETMYTHDRRIWIPLLSDDKKYFILMTNSNNYYEDGKVRVPDSYISDEYGQRYVVSILGSSDLKEFDLNPKNKYMKLIDNVVFSKDGKSLMSYAKFDERKKYSVPDGTEIIKQQAFECTDLTELFIPDSVTEIEKRAFAGMSSLEKISIPFLIEELNDTFWDCENLKEVYIPEKSKLRKISGITFSGTKISELTLPSFDIEIDKVAFVNCNKKNCITLKSYVKPDVKAVYSGSTDIYKLKWDKVSNASEYEVYQKLRDGSYKLLKTTKGTSINLNGIKSGKKYTFAVKPMAKIKASGDGTSGMVSYVGYDLPEYYTIEGTMSDDVTFKAK